MALANTTTIINALKSTGPYLLPALRKPPYKLRWIDILPIVLFPLYMIIVIIVLVNVFVNKRRIRPRWKKNLI